MSTPLAICPLPSRRARSQPSRPAPTSQSRLADEFTESLRCPADRLVAEPDHTLAHRRLCDDLLQLGIQPADDRDMMSAPPPGGQGTMKRMGLPGYACACRSAAQCQYP